MKQKDAETDENIQKRIATARQELEEAKVEGVHDKIIFNHDLDAAVEELERFIFGREENSGAGDSIPAEAVKDTHEAENHEVEMVDETAPAA